MSHEMVGKHVNLIGNHPWAGETGKIKSYEKMGVLPLMAYKVMLQNGIECFAKPELVKKI